MVKIKKDIEINSLSDSLLVQATLDGDRNAFCQIVNRYQSLLCSLAYSSVGDIKLSEDIAQEAFIEAWQKLGALREHEKLRPWLCGILRFKVSRYVRKETNQPLKGAIEVNEDLGGIAMHSGLEEASIKKQEERLMWQALEQIPLNYREPLILFYRESNSVEQVALELELTESAVKKRLSRGRKLLQEAMLKFVEGTLQHSKPGAAFTSAVLVAISGISPPAKAAAVGVGAVKAGSIFKWTSVLTVLASFSGVISSYFSVRATLDQSRTQHEKRMSLVIVARYFAVAVIYILAMLALRYFAQKDLSLAGVYTVISQVVVLGFVVSYLYLLVDMLKRIPKLRARERKRNPQAFLKDVDQLGSKQREYISQFTLFGIPLVHFKLGMPEEGDLPARGWIAGGDRAYGVLFAWGGFAVAPISVGIVSIGLISIGAVGFGLFSIGTVAIGVVALGASAVAYKAISSMSSLGWESAVSGGFAIAKEAAIGPIAYAKNTNTEIAAQIANLTTINQNYMWVLVVMSMLVIIPSIWHSSKVRMRMKK